MRLQYFIDGAYLPEIFPHHTQAQIDVVITLGLLDRDEFASKPVQLQSTAQGRLVCSTPLI